MHSDGVTATTTLYHSGMDEQLITGQNNNILMELELINGRPRKAGMVFQLFLHGCFLANACYDIAHSQDFYSTFVTCGSPGNEARQYCVVLEDS